jgi:hypothetical protein
VRRWLITYFTAGELRYARPCEKDAAPVPQARSTPTSKALIRAEVTSVDELVAADP